MEDKSAEKIQERQEELGDKTDKEGILEGAEQKIPEKVRKEMEKTRAKLDNFKKQMLKKFSYISSIGLLPPQASNIIEEEEEVKKEKDEKLMHVVVLVPDEKAKEVGKILAEGVRLIQGIKPKVWLHIKPTSEVWELCSDGKFEFIDAIAMSFPLHDKGLLGALRVATIHRTMCLKKFERYIVSYVIAGSLVRGQATKTSDVDVFVIIDDTDVKKTTRLELKEKLRSIILRYSFEAGDIAEVKNKLNVQIYILTEFWESVRDANPVIFTFIRDGVPLYDKGTFTPWKLLLKMGKITGTAEAVERFITIGEKISEDIKKKLTEIGVEDIYWSAIYPSQGVLMFYGLAPPTPKETVELMNKVFVEKEKILEKSYVNILEKIVGIYKAFEHEKIKSVSGKEIDGLAEQVDKYQKRLKKLVSQIEKKVGEKTVLHLHDDIVSLVRSIVGNVPEQQIAKKFSEQLVSKGLFPKSSLTILSEIIKVKNDYSKGKLSKGEIDKVRKDAQVLISTLMEYSQRAQLAGMEKIRFKAKIANKDGELFLLGDKAYLIPNLKEENIIKIDLINNKVDKAQKDELNDALKKIPAGIKLTQKILEKIENLSGEKIEIIL